MSKYLFSLLCDGKTGHYETDHNNNEKKLVIIIKLVIMKKVFFSWKVQILRDMKYTV